FRSCARSAGAAVVVRDAQRIRAVRTRGSRDLVATVAAAMVVARRRMRGEPDFVRTPRLATERHRFTGFARSRARPGISRVENSPDAAAPNLRRMGSYGPRETLDFSVNARRFFLDIFCSWPVQILYTL